MSGVAFSRDRNRNHLTGCTRTFSYDHANQLTSVVDGPRSFFFTCNGLGDRLQQTVDGLTIRYTLDLEHGLTQVHSDGTWTYLLLPITSGLPQIGEAGPAG